MFVRERALVVPRCIYVRLLKSAFAPFGRVLEWAAIGRRRAITKQDKCFNVLVLRDSGYTAAKADGTQAINPLPSSVYVLWKQTVSVRKVGRTTQFSATSAETLGEARYA